MKFIREDAEGREVVELESIEVAYGYAETIFDQNDQAVTLVTKIQVNKGYSVAVKRRDGTNIFKLKTL